MPAKYVIARTRGSEGDTLLILRLGIPRPAGRSQGLCLGAIQLPLDPTTFEKVDETFILYFIR